MTENNVSANQDAAIHFTPDQAAVVTREIENTFHALKVIHEAAKKPSADGLSTELATNVLKVAEFNLADLCKTLGIETDSAAERAQRFADLRAANMRVRELEAKLGASQAPEVTQASLKVMADHLNHWWDLEGFGHISDIAFGQYCCKVDFSCMLTGAYRRSYSDTPVSDKEREKLWHDSLRDRGFELVSDDREWSVADTEASRKALCDLITSRIPSAKVFKLENVYRSRTPGFILRSVEVYIHSIAEIMQLPTKEASATQEEKQP